MAVRVRGDIMSTNLQTAAAVEIDMRDLLQAKKARVSNIRKEPNSDYLSFISQILGSRFMKSTISLRAFKVCARS
jgi:hypothetical protein